jgi:hypothetical protein
MLGAHYMARRDISCDQDYNLLQVTTPQVINVIIIIIIEKTYFAHIVTRVNYKSDTLFTCNARWRSGRKLMSPTDSITTFSYILAFHQNKQFASFHDLHT